MGGEANPGSRGILRNGSLSAANILGEVRHISVNIKVSGSIWPKAPSHSGGFCANVIPRGHLDIVETGLNQGSLQRHWCSL